MHPRQLYFIGLMPPPDVRSEINVLKEEMRDRFQAKHALKSPPHITLQPPFRKTVAEEKIIFDSLSHFALEQTSFKLRMHGFGRFSNRVIFIQIKNPGRVIALFESLQSRIIHDFRLRPDDVSDNFHPHMTIATRDLSKSAFGKAWPEFEQRPFSATFKVDNIVLFKHNGKQWDIYRTFEFSS